MRCPECKADDCLEAHLMIKMRVPFLKGGGIKASGFTATEARALWDDSSPDIKHIECKECGAVYTYEKVEGLILKQQEEQ